MDPDSAPSELTLRWGIRNAIRDLRPQRLACGVIVEQLSGLPYRREVRNELGYGRIGIRCAFGGRIYRSGVWV